MSQNVQVNNLEDYMVHGVEFVGRITKNGRLIDYRTRNTVLLSDEQKEMFFMSISLYESMQRDFDENLGSVKYTITERKNFQIISIPEGQDIIVLIMKGSFASTIKRIKEAINYMKTTS
ncbi:MAG: hypothetical protein KGH76_05325 [Thaumarchaeota archaeon]|nr:hypothetical protein [Nitrososphaerota archaeon]